MRAESIFVCLTSDNGARSRIFEARLIIIDTVFRKVVRISGQITPRLPGEVASPAMGIMRLLVRRVEITVSGRSAVHSFQSRLYCANLY